ncbi:MAG: hypothetical protein LUH21_17275 [Clostridiales bacterium]|nr:hypothetical protein [Clostridiales bacterium]
MEDNERNNEVLNIDEPKEVRWYERQFSLDDAKTFIKANITTAARSFIAIGFYLKYVRDRNLFLEDGYQSVWEFAKAEYGISMSTASRYMTMNDRFSQDGNSPNVKEEYKAFGKSQLQEMLALTDEQLEQVKPTDRVEDIRGMRKPKEIPYIELPGQHEIEVDFPDIFPEEEFEIPPAPSVQKQEFSMDIAELAELVEDVLEGAAEAQQIEEPIAISQQEPEEQTAEPEALYFTLKNELTHDGQYGASLSMVVRTYIDDLNSRGLYPMSDNIPDIEVRAMGLEYQVMVGHEFVEFEPDRGQTVTVERKRLQAEYEFWYLAPKPEPEPQPRAWNIYATPCIHRDGFSCTVPDDKKNVPGDGSNCKESCCWECTQRGNCKLECNCSASRSEEPEPEPAKGLKQIGELNLSSRTENTLKRAGIDTVKGLASMSDEELIAVRGMSNRSVEEIKTKLEDLDSVDKPEPESVIDAAYEEIPEERPYTMDMVMVELLRWKDRRESSKPGGSEPSEVMYKKACMMYDAMMALHASMGGEIDEID